MCFRYSEIYELSLPLNRIKCIVMSSAEKWHCKAILFVLVNKLPYASTLKVFFKSAASVSDVKSMKKQPKNKPS